MPLSDIDKDRIRYHLGYPATLTVSSMAFGIPAPIETLFLVETAMGLLKDGWPTDKVRQILDIMEGIECKLVKAQSRFAAEELEGLKLRGSDPGKSEPDMLEREYARWGLRLCDVLRVPFYPYSQRFSAATGVTAGSIPVL